jgi:peptide/nickel transport system permease protein
MEKKKGGLLGTLWRTKKVSFFCMLVLLAFIFAAVFADALAPQKMQNGMLQSRLLEAMQAPSLKHPLGTDAMGRDLLSYMLYGARTSVIIGLTCTVLTTAISVVLGASSAVIGGRFDLYLQRVIDAWQCIPGMLVSLILMSMFGSGIPQMILVLSIPGGIGGSRMIRSAAISVKDSGYCNMSRMMGGGSHWRLWKHVVPNVMPLILMNLANCLGGTIMAESTLSFLGFGVPVNTPDWGALLTAQGRSKMYSAPWIGLAPGIAITLMVFAAAMLGDGLRDVLDPRLKGGMGTFSLKKIHKIAAKYVASLKKEGAKANAKA